MDLLPNLQRTSVLPPESYPGRFQVVGLSADPDHFVVRWRVESSETPPGLPGLALGNLAAESLLMAALHGRAEGRRPELLSLKTDFFDCQLPLRGVVVEVDCICHGRGILSLEAYLYHETEKLLAKASATFTTTAITL
ncbi:MAG: hypothetical protein ICV83_03890 [Cytophagales bacterium]|nr:hypothetical protein [Cytophagales bacterium]